MIAVLGGLLCLRYLNGGLRPAGVGGMFTEQRSLMGTVWTIEVPDHGRSQESARLAVAAAYRELERIDALMSEWKPESPISQVDAAAGVQPVEVPAELRELIERSVAYSQQTEGTFDITWRGMGKIWHFDDAFQVPSTAAVARARKSVDYRAIQIQGNRIFLPAGMSIGLGGIAKGYAVDRAARVLARAGFTDSLVDGGGDLLASGTKYGKPWRLGVQNPRAEHGKILGVVSLSNAALVSSGDYERFRIVDGIRYHHIIDPRTGWPANASIGVTVLAKSAEQGVVLGKGIFILGPEKGLA
ncbi:MAG TPA: FAD:protein FMN transferase, partial [Bryobacteraceae bacterium]|nr:FAD:protein FMN transferase [Bryobacteraceae bacterium]